MRIEIIATVIYNIRVIKRATAPKEREKKKMKKIVVNGKEIVTNLGESGAETIVRGDNLPNYVICVKNSYRETDEEFVERLSKYYSRIRLARTTTMIRGIYNTFAYCR